MDPGPGGKREMGWEVGEEREKTNKGRVDPTKSRVQGLQQ